MKFDIGAIFGQLVGLFVRLPLSQKIALPLLLAGSMGIIVFVSRWAGQPSYRVLFSDLAEGDAAGVVEKLKEQKVGFRLTNDGRTVEITPPEMVNELRLDLAATGLPKGGTVGFELFDSNVLGRTGFVEKLTFMRAIQGELERTIQSIDAVKNVRVHITNPERSSFAKRDTLPTASVLLRVKAGAELTPVQVKGIANLVAASVERLTPDNVRIVDAKGSLLNEKREENDPNTADVNQLDYRGKIEKVYARQIEDLLGGILGPGKAIAKVSADLDFSSFQKEEESYDPGSKVTRSERSVEEAAGLTAEGGVPGVISNLSNDPGVLTPPDSAKNSNRRIESVKNFEVSRAVSKTINTPGKIQKISVAVLVDGQYTQEGAPKAEGAAPAPKIYKPLPPEMMQKIENLVKQAVGYDNLRGDVVTVENIRFFEPDDSLEQELAKTEMADMITKYASWVVPLIFILLFFVIILRPMVGFIIKPTESEVDLSRLLPTGVEELEAELEVERGRVNAMPTQSNSSIDIEQLEGLLAENSRIVHDNPQQAALLIRYWLNEGRL